MRTATLVITLLAAGCSLEPFEPTVGTDAGGRLDAGRADGGRADAGGTDAGGTDAGDTDAGGEITDAGGTDAGTDAGPVDACVPSAETCNGADDDCDGRIDQGLSMACMNACGVAGTIDCVGGALTACDAPPEPPETCNGIDDDCNGVIDDGAGCPCRLEHFGSHAYLFCTRDDDWLVARDACRADGYELVTIDDATENAFVETTALMMRGGRDWWIGLNDRATEGMFVWSAGDVPPGYTNWGPGEPTGNFQEDCARLTNGDRAPEVAGGWADTRCNENNPYVCESP